VTWRRNPAHTKNDLLGGFKVNFVNCNPADSSITNTQVLFHLLLVLLFSFFFFGCSDEVAPPSAEQLTRFENAGPRSPIVDMNRLVNARIGGGPHRVVPGEVLELTMPTILQIVTAEEPEISGRMAPYVCRLSETGTITLPVVGEIKVAGMTLAEIELTVINAFHPEYTESRPPVFAKVLEYKTTRVSITGAVNKPGVYSLRSDQTSLVALLMEAEGIVDEGAAFIQIIHADQVMSGDKTASITAPRPALTTGETQSLYTLAASPKLSYGLRGHESGILSENTGLYQKFSTADSKQIPGAVKTMYRPDLRESPEIAGHLKPANSQESRSIILPVKGLNIPFADVALRDGDRVIVERLREPMITVVGLVNRAGNFPYRPDVEYNLMQALGFAGGLNLSAEPRYATVYRLAEDGTTVSAVFNIAGIAKSIDPTGALSVALKPYDVVAVEHTPRTRAKVFWDRVFRFYISTHITSEDIFGED